jgi:hypothetical protein
MDSIYSPDPAQLSPLRDLHIGYGAVQAAAEKIHELRVHGQTDERKGRCAILYGPTGAGKSRCIDAYIESANGEATKRGAAALPIRKIELPTKCTTKTLNELLLRELGSTMEPRETVPMSTVRAANGIIQQRWELLILDEAQHLIRHNTAAVAYEVADHCKKLLDASGCPILFVGLQQIEEIMRENPQLRRRSAPAIVLSAFDFDQREERNTFRAILSKFDEALPFAKSAELDDIDMAKRIHIATGGVIGEVTRLIYDGSIIALRENARTLLRSHLGAAFDSYRLSGESSKLNPFTVDELPESSRPQDSRHGMRRVKGQKRRNG